MKWLVVAENSSHEPVDFIVGVHMQFEMNDEGTFGCHGVVVEMQLLPLALIWPQDTFLCISEGVVIRVPFRS